MLMGQWVDEEMRVRLLVEELFAAVETPQGYFHVSDGETFTKSAELFERTRGRLKWGREAVRKMEGFLRKHGELRGQRKR